MAVPISSEESLPTKIQKCLHAEVQKEMEKICGLLRTELRKSMDIILNIYFLQ